MYFHNYSCAPDPKFIIHTLGYIFAGVKMGLVYITLHVLCHGKCNVNLCMHTRLYTIQLCMAKFYSAWHSADFKSSDLIGPGTFLNLDMSTTCMSPDLRQIGLGHVRLRHNMPQLLTYKSVFQGMQSAGLVTSQVLSVTDWVSVKRYSETQWAHPK